jgi:hypothetical protein
MYVCMYVCMYACMYVIISMEHVPLCYKLNKGACALSAGYLRLKHTQNM